MNHFERIVCGGTFDHFHKGHEHFLEFILASSENVLLGITSDEFIGIKKYSEALESYHTRKQAVEKFFKKKNALARVEIEPISSVYIPKKWETLRINALIVSEETKKGAEQINEKRLHDGLNALPLVIAPFVLAEDGKHISSSRIRRGEITRDGTLCIRPEWLVHKLQLPQTLRKKLQEPFGELIQTIPQDGSISQELFQDTMQRYGAFVPSQIITVGDVVTRIFNATYAQQWLSVVDFHVQRKKRYSHITDIGFSGTETVVRIANKAGFLTPDLFIHIQKIFKEKNDKRVILYIDGEEDLAVLVSLLGAPLDYTIFYGQPHQGMVRVPVTEERKKMAYDMVYKFVSTDY